MTTINKLDEEQMKISYTYPEINDDLQYNLYKKREFYGNRIPKRPDVNDYKDIKEYRDNTCAKPFALHPHQAMLSNFINPDTPYKGIVIFHGLGTGKTCVGISIAEKFKPLIQKYNTKIIVLVSGPLIKENWKSELLKCTGETYLKYQDKTVYISENEKIKNEKLALTQALQYYRFMSYRSFYKHVLGEKILENKDVEGDKKKVSYKKTEEGEFERDLSVDRIYNLNNSLIIVDEAHNITDNVYGDALKHIIKNSINLKIVLLTGTPMKNLADDIIDLVNFIRPEDSPILRDKVFSIHKNHMMEFKQNGLAYLKNMMKGYISHVRGSDPLQFATKVEKGVKPKEFSFTHVTRCKMLNFQKNIYDISVKEHVDTLDRKTEAVSNFVFPGLSQNKKEIIGLYGREGLGVIKNQLKIYNELINKKLSQLLENNDNEKNMLLMTGDNKTITGKIFNIKYLKNFSTKFYYALKKINRLVNQKKGAKTAFIYSNLVKVGIELFEQVLIQNGYLEYQENTSNYTINSNTVCYYCGLTYDEHKTNTNTKSKLSRNKKSKLSTKFNQKYHKNNNSNSETETETETESETETETESETETNIESDIETETNSELNNIFTLSDKSLSSSEYEPHEITSHTFYPATFLTITGKANDEGMELIPEDKKRTLDKVFNMYENREGKNLKLILGSKVMNEGISLKFVGEVHILDVHYNLGKVDQVIGRAIRWCSHYKLMNENNIFPKVNVYKYVVCVDKGLSTEEDLYRKAELKYLLVKKVERAMKEIAIDCPLNINGNMFKEEIEKYKNCENDPDSPCTAICDYQKCNYKCDSVVLNTKYYDPNRNIYKLLSKDELDYTTFNNKLARHEIDFSKEIIKNMYITNYIFTLKEIITQVKKKYKKDNLDLFDEFYVYQALYELIPLTENDFNNYKDTIVDKYNRMGYLIYINKYYIYQPFDQKENIPMVYRTTEYKQIKKEFTLYDYLLTNTKFKDISSDVSNEKIITSKEIEQYNFENVMEYYDNRDEYNYVGFVDKDKLGEEVFKLREKRDKILEKKRGTGIQSLQGAVCSTSKTKKYLIKVAKQLGIEIKNKLIRENLCNEIKEKMLELEKYSTGKDKITYIMIPENHKLYEFPYNLEDRVEFVINKLRKSINLNLEINTESKKVNKNMNYIIIINDNIKLNEYIDILNSMNAIKKGGKWEINIK
jgi:hypothetical protein